MKGHSNSAASAQQISRNMQKECYPIQPQQSGIQAQSQQQAPPAPAQAPPPPPQQTAPSAYCRQDTLRTHQKMQDPIPSNPIFIQQQPQIHNEIIVPHLSYLPQPQINNNNSEEEEKTNLMKAFNRNRCHDSLHQYVNSRDSSVLSAMEQNQIFRQQSQEQIAAEKKLAQSQLQPPPLYQPPPPSQSKSTFVYSQLNQPQSTQQQQQQQQQHPSRQFKWQTHTQIKHKQLAEQQQKAAQKKAEQSQQNHTRTLQTTQPQTSPLKKFPSRNASANSRLQSGTATATASSTTLTQSSSTNNNQINISNFEAKQTDSTQPNYSKRRENNQTKQQQQQKFDLNPLNQWQLFQPDQSVSSQQPEVKQAIAEKPQPNQQKVTIKQSNSKRSSSQKKRMESQSQSHTQHKMPTFYNEQQNQQQIQFIQQQQPSIMLSNIPPPNMSNNQPRISLFDQHQHSSEKKQSHFDSQHSSAQKEKINPNRFDTSSYPLNKSQQHHLSNEDTQQQQKQKKIPKLQIKQQKQAQKPVLLRQTFTQEPNSNPSSSMILENSQLHSERSLRSPSPTRQKQMVMLISPPSRKKQQKASKVHSSRKKNSPTKQQSSITNSGQKSIKKPRLFLPKGTKKQSETTTAEEKVKSFELEESKESGQIPLPSSQNPPEVFEFSLKKEKKIPKLNLKPTNVFAAAQKEEESEDSQSALTPFFLGSLNNNHHHHTIHYHHQSALQSKKQEAKNAPKLNMAATRKQIKPTLEQPKAIQTKQLTFIEPDTQRNNQIEDNNLQIEQEIIEQQQESVDAPEIIEFVKPKVKPTLEILKGNQQLQQQPQKKKEAVVLTLKIPTQKQKEKAKAKLNQNTQALNILSFEENFSSISAANNPSASSSSSQISYHILGSENKLNSSDLQHLSVKIAERQQSQAAAAAAISIDNSSRRSQETTNIPISTTTTNGSNAFCSWNPVEEEKLCDVIASMRKKDRYFNEGNHGRPGHQRYSTKATIELCYYCLSSSHLQAACPQKPCFKCGQIGHEKNACKVSQPKCSQCGRLGHQKRECALIKSDFELKDPTLRRPAIQGIEIFSATCFNCRKLGHLNCNSSNSISDGIYSPTATQTQQNY